MKAKNKYIILILLLAFNLLNFVGCSVYKSDMPTNNITYVTDDEDVVYLGHGFLTFKESSFKDFRTIITGKDVKNDEFRKSYQVYIPSNYTELSLSTKYLYTWFKPLKYIKVNNKRQNLKINKLKHIKINNGAEVNDLENLFYKEYFGEPYYFRSECEVLTIEHKSPGVLKFKISENKDTCQRLVNVNICSAFTELSAKIIFIQAAK